MLVYGSKLKNMPVLSLQAGGAIAWTDTPIIAPETLKILGFKLVGPLVNRAKANILDVTSVREYSSLGMVIDSIEEFVAKADVVKIATVLDLNFSLIGLKVVTKKGARLGKIIDFTCTSNDFMVQQIIVQRPPLKAFLDSNLIISRKEIIEITDYKVVVKDEEKKLKEKATNEDFIPNFVNPFRGQHYVPNHNQSLDELDTE